MYGMVKQSTEITAGAGNIAEYRDYGKAETTAGTDNTAEHRDYGRAASTGEQRVQQA